MSHLDDFLLALTTGHRCLCLGCICLGSVGLSSKVYFLAIQLTRWGWDWQYAHCPLPHIVTERMGSIRRVPKSPEFEWHEFPGMTSWQPYSLEKTEVWSHFKNMIPYNIAAMRPEQSWPEVLINLCLLIPPTQHHSPHLAPCLWTHMETTYCKLDLAATHDVVQERMHLVDLQRRRRGNRFSNSVIYFLTQWKLKLWG